MQPSACAVFFITPQDIWTAAAALGLFTFAVLILIAVTRRA